MDKSFIIAQYNHIGGTLEIHVYDGCVNESDALLAFAEDEGYHDIPDVAEVENEDATDILLNWFEDMDISTEIKELETWSCCSHNKRALLCGVCQDTILLLVLW